MDKWPDLISLAAKFSATIISMTSDLHLHTAPWSYVSMRTNRLAESLCISHKHQDVARLSRVMVKTTPRTPLTRSTSIKCSSTRSSIGFMGVSGLRNVGFPRSLIFSVVGFTSGIVYATKCFDYWNRRKKLNST